MKGTFRVFLFIAAAAGIGGFVSMMQDRPRLIPVTPAEKRPAMPEFAFPSMSGAEWSLDQHRGKIVLVNFWATWCGPCREETPDLVRVFAEYRDRGVEFAGVSMDRKPADVVPAFAQQYKVPYPILVPPAESALANAIESLPTTFLLDRNGRVARTWRGMLRARELTKNLDELLAERTQL